MHQLKLLCLNLIKIMNPQSLKFNFNKIFVIESLSLDETKTGTNIFNDIIKRRIEAFPQMEAELVKVNSQNDLLNFFNKMNDEVSHNSLKPYFHFEIHGSTTGLQLNSGEDISWFQLHSYFVKINIKCKNNLWISLATCYGAYIFRIIRPTDRAPFFGYIGSWDVLYSNEIEAGFGDYFNTLLTTLDLNKSLESLNNCNTLSTEYKIYHCNAVFDQIYKRYEDESYEPEAFNDRVKTLMEAAKEKSKNKLRLSNKILKDKLETILLDKKKKFRREKKAHFLMFDLYPSQKKRYS